MKMASCLVMLMLVFAVPPPAKGAPEADLNLALSLANRIEQKTLEITLHNLHSVPAPVLLQAADIAARNERLEDAGFFFYAGLMRVKFDIEAFPPIEDPTPLLESVDELGLSIVPQLLADAEKYGNVVQRLEKFPLVPPSSYDPGWQHEQPISEQEMQTIAKNVKERLLRTPRNLAKLLCNPKYMENLKIDLGALFSDQENDDFQNARQQQAQQELYEIEREMGLEGMYYSQGKHEGKIEQN